MKVWLVVDFEFWGGDEDEFVGGGWDFGNW